MEHLITRAAPDFLRPFIMEKAPAVLLRDGQPIPLVDNGTDAYTGAADGLSVELRYAWDKALDSIIYYPVLKNETDVPIGNLRYIPIELWFAVDARKNLPCVRHLSGSDHYNGIYPTTAFRLHEEVYMTHDHCKRVVLDGACARKDVPILQFAIFDDKGEHRAGFFIGMEWSGSWNLSAGWNAESWHGQRPEDYFFTVNGDMALLELEVPAHGELALPKVYMGFFEGDDFDTLENKQRRFMREKLMPRIDGQIVPGVVACNSWFGIYMDLNHELIRQEIIRAAELGCEYYVLDAGWYYCPNDIFDGGIGNWDTADPRKFVKGYDGIKELAELCRSLGMKFGSWMYLQASHEHADAYKKRPELFRESTTPDNRGLGKFIKLETPDGVDYAVELLSKLIDDWGLKYFKHESGPEDGLAYNEGYNEVIRRILAKYPDLIIMDCNGGGMRLDMNMVGLTHTNSLSDHHGNAEVCRFMQTGALHFWPYQYLSLAVIAFMNRPSENATTHNVLSRMVGTLEFMGDVASWTPEETKMVRELVDIYKQTRHLKDQDTFFPLPQTRTVKDWDMVVFGDGKKQQQLLFVFRTYGEESVRVKLPGGAGEWKLLCGDEATVTADGDYSVVTMPKTRSSALFIR
ncbi:MAG: alpha-galactosidase [Clostridia bacterium]|nr:alpha-galactosidase [Clostridia bacterium]